jgi:hypothetical protein
LWFFHTNELMLKQKILKDLSILFNLYLSRCDFVLSNFFDEHFFREFMWFLLSVCLTVHPAF